jgi:hypothetical protein
MAITTYSDIQALVPSFVAFALTASRETGPMRNLVQTYQMQSGTLTLPETGTVNVAAMTEGVPLSTFTTLNVGSVTLTSGKYGGAVSISDEAVNRAKAGNFDIIKEAATGLGTAFGIEIDKALVGLFAGLSNTVGSAGTELTVAEYGKALAKLRKNNVPTPYYCVLHPYQAYNLFKDLKAPDSSKGFPAGLDNATRPFFEQTLFNVPIFTDGNIVADANDDAHGAMFNPLCFALGIENELQVEVKRIESMGWEIYAWGRFAVAERKDAYGVGMFYDAAL